MGRDNHRSPRFYVIDAKDSELDCCSECGEVIVPGRMCPCCDERTEESPRSLRPAA